jgi:hypothetical protein
MIKSYVSYKINTTKQHNYLVQERIKDICKIIDEKNPTLMKEIKKGSLQGLQNLAQSGQKIDINS